MPVLPLQRFQIGVQEALAVWLLGLSFKKLLGGTLLRLYADHDELRRQVLQFPLLRLRLPPWWLYLVCRFAGAPTPNVL